MSKSIECRIFASSDSEGVFVYQAFCHSIADEAVLKGTFGTQFGRRRMTWIKPSLGWMMYRSGYATKHNQERVLRIKVSFEGFHTLLSQAVLAKYDPLIHESEDSWSHQCSMSAVRVQWDPDRDLYLDPIPGRRAIQLGIGPELVGSYVDSWILGVEDVTSIIHEIRAVTQEQPTMILNHPYPEVEIPVNPVMAKTLGIALGLPAVEYWHHDQVSESPHRDSS